MKKIYFLIIAIVCVMSVNAQYGGGDGVTTPYEISTTDHLVTLGTDVANWDKKFILMNDLDMTGLTFHSLGYFLRDGSWGNATDAFFTGEFDGNNKVISNIVVSTHPDRDVNGTNVFHSYQLGFFGQADGAVIMDLGLVNLTVSGAAIHRVGGLVGTSKGGTTITNCFVNGGSVYGNSDGVGGLVGWFEGGGNITNCYTEVDITVNGDGPNGAGIIGKVQSAGTSVVTNAVVYGTTIGTNRAIVGAGDITYTNVYYAQGSGAVDGLATEITDLSAQSSYTGFDFTSTWEIDANRSYAILQGFAGLPLAISDVNISNTKVICIGKTLYIDTEEVEQGIYTIYNLSGVVVAQGEFAGSGFTETLNIQKGIYIVKVGALATKIKVD